MSSADLVMAICLVVAVTILGAAIAWAFMEARRDSVHRDERPSRRSQNQSLKGKGTRRH